MEQTGGHMLSLKVMRVSQPTLTQATQPFFSTSPSLSAHATASLLCLQGVQPLPGHPKTLRDFSLTEVLTLPSAFGNISLGEIFSSAMCVNNESGVKVHGVQLKVEMQTATTKILLANFGGQDKDLDPSETLEVVASHEVKELNQHVLACTVSYHIPGSMMHLAGPVEDPNNPTLRVIRKYYKFTVSNPLSVKTKVHIPKSPSALLDKNEREKVFLEVHVQNLTQEPLYFDRMRFECVEGWNVQDIGAWRPPSENSDDSTTENVSTSIFSGATAYMQPQDIRQYLYILSPAEETTPPFPVSHQPGAIIPLGRLDICWRSGRLLTSVLSRRIPLLPVPAPAPAIPPHLIHQQQQPRPQSPGFRPQSRPSSPAPFKPRVAPSSRPQSPGPGPSPSANPQFIPRSNVEVDLVVKSLDHRDIWLEEPFSVDFALTACAPLPGQPNRHRRIALIAQHVLPPRPENIPLSLLAATSTGFSPRPPTPEVPYQVAYRSHSSRASASVTSITSSKRGSQLSWIDSPPTEIQSPVHYAQSPVSLGHDSTASDRKPKFALPAPFREDDPTKVVSQRQTPSTDPTPSKSEEGNTTFIGSSTIRLPLVRISSSSPRVAGNDPSDPPRGLASVDFSLQFLPLREGFANIGGLRILLVNDEEVEAEPDESTEPNQELDIKDGTMEPRVLKEFDVVAEVWVRGLRVAG